MLERRQDVGWLLPPEEDHKVPEGQDELQLFLRTLTRSVQNPLQEKRSCVLDTQRDVGRVQICTCTDVGRSCPAGGLFHHGGLPTVRIGRRRRWENERPAVVGPDQEVVDEVPVEPGSGLLA